MAVCQLEVPASFSDLARASGPVTDSEAAALKLKLKLTGKNLKLPVVPGPGSVTVEALAANGARLATGPTSSSARAIIMIPAAGLLATGSQRDRPP
jgi:hypothetical protein